MDSKEERQHKLQLATGLARGHNPLRSRLIRETAEWMATEVKRCGRLDHHQAANAIRQRSPYHELFGGRALTYVTQNATTATAQYERSADFAQQCWKHSNS
jgi:hypothetical protein